MTDRFSEEAGAARLRGWLIATLLGVVVFCAVALWLDQPARWLPLHVMFEAGTAVVGALVALRLWLGWRGAERSAAALRRSVRDHGAQRDAWRRSAGRALEGLARAIDAQFADWKLTPAERQVALLLLKGYSHKQVAQATGRSERTARQHAATVYRKAGLDGRAELAAYFLDDLMLPEAEREVLAPVES